MEETDLTTRQYDGVNQEIHDEFGHALDEFVSLDPQGILPEGYYAKVED